MNPEAIKEYYGVLDKFGIADAEFFGYWDNAGLIGGQTETIKASAYRKPQGGALIVVYNTGRKEGRVTLAVDWRKLTSKDGLLVVDAYIDQPLIDQPIAIADGTMTLDVPPLNYRLLWVK